MLYIQARSEEPCSKSTLVGFSSALNFFERGGGVPANLQLAADPLVRAATSEAIMQITSHDTSLPKKAPRLSVAIRASWVLAACRETMPEYLRLFSFRSA